MSVLNKLSFQLAAPILAVTMLLWLVLYFFVAAAIKEFARERAEEDLRSISREVLNICNSRFDEFVKGGDEADRVGLRVTKALTMGELEDLFLEFNVDGIIYGDRAAGRRVLLETKMAKKAHLNETGKLQRHELQTVQAGNTAFFAYPFVFQPWGWHVVLFRKTSAYVGLALIIRNLYWTTGGLLLVMAIGLIVLDNRLLRRPVNSIIEKLRLGEPPNYRGVEEFEFLSSSISHMMKNLAEREARLRQSEIRYRTIFDTTGTSIIIAEEDTTISLANSQFVQDTGYSREEVEGKKSWTEIVAEHDLERMKELNRLRRSDPAAGLRQYDFTMIDKYGNRKDMLLTADLIPGTSQTIASLIDITDRKKEELEHRLEQEALAAQTLRRKNAELAREIEERKRMENALRFSEERFRAIFETTADYVFIKNTDLKYTHVNPAFLHLLDRDRSEVIGRTDEELLFDPDYAINAKKLETRVLNGETLETGHILNWKGWPISLNVIRFPLRHSQGNIFGLCGMARDVSDWKYRESESVMTDPADYPSPTIQQTVQRVRLAAENDSTVLFVGESGTGKDHWARILHERSNRAGGAFLTINCAALSPELVESELFGHESGAFTGAKARKRGLLELAEGGTLLLNEIGEMPLSMQSKLLTFMDTQTILRVGGQESITVDVRILAATNRNLEQEMQDGRFRADLFYRLDVFTIAVPPLRDRIEDIPIVVRELLSGIGEKMGLSGLPAIDPGSMDALLKYHWPGNVRELRNVLERALILCDREEKICPIHLGLREVRHSDSRSGGAALVEELFPEGISFHKGLDEAKRLLILRALDRSGGSIKEAAALLGMTRNSINHHIRHLGIEKGPGDKE